MHFYAQRAIFRLKLIIAGKEVDMVSQYSYLDTLIEHKLAGKQMLLFQNQLYSHRKLKTLLTNQ